jgi:uncharacterized membrane protein required for colicin V production
MYQLWAIGMTQVLPGELGAVPSSTWVTAGAAALVAFLAGLAFSRGVLRQLLNMLSLAISVAVAWYVFRYRSDVFGTVGSDLSTDRLLLFSAGAGVLTYLLCKLLLGLLAAAGLLQVAGRISGMRGMLISTVPSAFMLWVGAMILRLVGNIYGLETASTVGREGTRLQSEFGAVWQEWSKKLDRSVLGSLTSKIDPLEMRPTANLARLLILWPDGTVWASLARDEKTRAFLHHPQIQTLGRDAEIRRLIERKDFAGLLQNEKVNAVVVRQDLRPVLKGLALEEAMDTIIYKRKNKADDC